MTTRAKTGPDGRCQLAAPAPFDAADKVVGYGFGLALLRYVTVLHWRLRRGSAGVKPIQDLVDPDPW